MKHTMYTFRLHRSGAVLAAIGCLLLAVLIFAAGYLSGVRQKTAAAGVALPAAPKPPKVAAPRVPERPKIAAPALPTRPAGGGAASTAAAPAAAASAGKPAPETLTLQVGTFTAEEEAKELVARLEARQLPAGLAQAAGDAGPLYVVQVGRYATRREAATAAGELSQRHGIAASVVAAPPVDAPPGAP